MKAKIRNKEEIAKHTLLTIFDLLGQNAEFIPGQYFFVTLPKLNYPDQRGNRRHFSIINSPNEKGVLSFATRLRESSGFKKTLIELPLETEVELGPIAGNFQLPQSNEQQLVFIAGGIGITPFISMLKFIEEEGFSYNITLIYSNRDRESITFYEELTKLSKVLINFKLVLTLTEDGNWSGESRRVDSLFIREYIKDFSTALFMVAGPPKMTEAIVSSLKQLGIDDKNIKRENFSGY